MKLFDFKLSPIWFFPYGKLSYFYLIDIIIVKYLISYAGIVIMETITLSSKFQIVIPKKTREALKFKAGDKIVILEKGDSIELVKIGNIANAMGIFKGISSEGLRDRTERFD